MVHFTFQLSPVYRYFIANPQLTGHDSNWTIKLLVTQTMELTQKLVIFSIIIIIKAMYVILNSDENIDRHTNVNNM